MQNNTKYRPPHLNNSYYEKTLKLLEERKRAKPLKTFRKQIIDS